MRTKWVQHVSQTWTVGINGSTGISSLDFSRQLFLVTILKLVLIVAHLGRALKSPKKKTVSQRETFQRTKEVDGYQKNEKRFHFVSGIHNCTSIIGTSMCIPLLSINFPHSILYNMTKNKAMKSFKQTFFLPTLFPFRNPIVCLFTACPNFSSDCLNCYFRF